jgi:hypothetical protein
VVAPALEAAICRDHRLLLGKRWDERVDERWHTRSLRAMRGRGIRVFAEVGYAAARMPNSPGTGRLGALRTRP